MLYIYWSEQEPILPVVLGVGTVGGGTPWATDAGSVLCFPLTVFLADDADDADDAC